MTNRIVGKPAVSETEFYNDWARVSFVSSFLAESWTCEASITCVHPSILHCNVNGTVSICGNDTPADWQMAVTTPLSRVIENIVLTIDPIAIDLQWFFRLYYILIIFSQTLLKHGRIKFGVRVCSGNFFSDCGTGSKFRCRCCLWAEWNFLRWTAPPVLAAQCRRYNWSLLIWLLLHL